MSSKPLVGLLYNPAVPEVVDHAPDLVEYIEVIPERLWHDFGDSGAMGGRFHRMKGAVEALQQCAGGRPIAAHGLGLSLPSAMPLDQALLENIRASKEELGYHWYSEHLSVFVVPNGRLPNAQAGLGLPVAYDEEVLQLLKGKLEAVREALGCELLLENPAVFTPVPGSEMSEPEFFNRLYAETGTGMLLDLHNLYVSYRNGGPDPHRYLTELDPRCVWELHFAGGDELGGFYTDSHSRPSPQPVWDLASECTRRFEDVRALVFEFHESHYERIGLRGIVRELERMQRLSERLQAGLASIRPRAASASERPNARVAVC